MSAQFAKLEWGIKEGQASQFPITNTRNSMTTKAQTKPAKKSSADIKAKLAKGAAEYQKERAKAAKKPAKRVDDSTSKKKPAKKGDVLVEPPLPKIVPAKGKIEDILALRVKQEDSSLTLDPETTAEEYVRIFDEMVGYGDRFQLLIGDLIIAGEKLKAFGGKYAQAMLATGRSIHSLRAYRSTAFNTPKKLRLLPYSHLHATLPAEAIEDKERIIKNAVALAKDGKMPSVKEIKAEVAKVKPRNKKKKAPAAKQKPAKVTRDLTTDESDSLIALEDTAAKLESQIGGASFLLEAKSEDTMTLREKLAAIARFSAQLEG